MGNLPVCRCEEISLDEVVNAVHEGATSVDGVKRRTRAGMGMCQGRTCGRLTADIIARETGLTAGDVRLARVRPPLRPVRVGAIAGLKLDIETQEDVPPWEGETGRTALPAGGEELNVDCEFLVVGAGAVGSSTAYHLARLGRDVVLIDKGDLAEGTSGATQAWVWVHPKTPAYYGKFSWDSAKRYATLSEELDTDLEYRQLGGMVGLLTQEEVDAAKKRVEANRSIGMDVTLLTREEALSMEPRLNSNILAATFSPIDGDVNPFRLLQGFTKKMSALGGRVYLNAPLRSVQPGDRQGWTVVTDRGRIRCRVLIIAAGIATPWIAKMAGADVPVKPVRVPA